MLLVLPTGAGKTEIAIELIKRSLQKRFRAVYFAHREELLFQPRMRFGAHGIETTTLKGQARYDETCSVAIASVQTAFRRKTFLQSLSNCPRLVTIIDEAHRIGSPMYQPILMSLPASSFLVGLTATPYRLDGKSLAPYFSCLLEDVTPEHLFAKGWLKEPRIFLGKTPDTDGVMITQRDYHVASLRARCMPIVGDVVNTWAERSQRAQSVVYACDVEHATALVRAFRAHDAVAELIYAGTPNEDRSRFHVEFAKGKINALVNVDVLTEGYDHASYATPGEPYVPLGAIFIARPTLSMGLFFQMLGRITRPTCGGLVFDHAGNTLRHGFLRNHHGFTLDGEMGGVSIAGKWRQQPLRRCPVCELVYSAASTTCACGSRLGKPRNLRVKNGDLVEVATQVKRRPPTTAEKKSELLRLLTTAKRKRYDTGWAMHQFNAKFGHFPSPTMRSELYKELGIAPKERHPWKGAI